MRYAKRGCPNEARADELDHAYATPGFHNAGWRHGRIAARAQQIDQVLVPLEFLLD